MMKINKKQDAEDFFSPISLEEFNLVEDWVVDPTLNGEELNEQDLIEESNELGLQLRTQRGNIIVLLYSSNKYLNYITICNLDMLFIFNRK